MDAFTRRSLETLCGQFEAGAEKYPELRHGMAIGGSPPLGLGGEMVLWRSADPKREPQFAALDAIARGLAGGHPTPSTVFSHQLVLLESDSPDAFDGRILLVRSVLYAPKGDPHDSGYVRYQQLAREAAVHVRQLDPLNVRPWSRFAIVGNTPGQESHYWSAGVVRWSIERRIPTVPVSEGAVSLIGGPLHITDPVTGDRKPLQFTREDGSVGDVETPYLLYFGSLDRSVSLPDVESCRSLLLEMCNRCRVAAIDIDVFSASAQALRWLLTREVSAPRRIYPEQVDTFTRIGEVPAQAVASLLNIHGRLDVSEDFIQRALEEILGEQVHKTDWGGELNDLFTTHLRIDGTRVASAFMLKGRGLRARVLTIAQCGKSGDQLVRLTRSPADLFVVQFVGAIDENVIHDIDQKILALRASGQHARFMILDGQDTARLLVAYGKLHVGAPLTRRSS